MESLHPSCRTCARVSDGDISACREDRRDEGAGSRATRPRTVFIVNVTTDSEDGDGDTNVRRIKLNLVGPAPCTEFHPAGRALQCSCVGEAAGTDDF